MASLCPGLFVHIMDIKNIMFSHALKSRALSSQAIFNGFLLYLYRISPFDTYKQDLQFDLVFNFSRLVFTKKSGCVRKSKSYSIRL